MSTKNRAQLESEQQQYAGPSLISVMLTAVAITVNHVYTLGAPAFLLGATLLVVPAVFWAWFRKTGSQGAFAGYMLMNLWMVTGFGLMKGLWDTTLRVFLGTLLASVSTSFPKPAIGAFGLEIGVIVPTDGPYAILGTSFVKAVQMAKDDLKDTKYQYQLVIRDSGPDPAKARDVIRRVIADDKVDAIVGGISLIGQVTKPYAAKARIPHTCVCTVTSIGDGAYNFTNIPSPEAEGALWAREAKRRGIGRVALISQDYPSINNHVKALKVEAARVGLAITDEQTFEDSVSDFRSIIEHAEASRPDVYYVEALNPGLDRLGEQLSEAKIRNVASVVAPSLSDKVELFEGTWYTDSNLRDVAFKKRFEDKYPGTRFATHMMPYAYDSVNMIVQAFERGQNPAVYLRNIRAYDGTAGPLTKQPGSGNFTSSPAVWVITNGQPVLTARTNR